jgi:predicted carbohydrate-binding protein with CBM5 and CBM33 domain
MKIRHIACGLAFQALCLGAHAEARHGAVEFPIARQLNCYKAQDFSWPADGSGIKNPACRAAYQEVYKKHDNNQSQATIQFNQWNEYAKNIPNYNDFEEVKKAIPDHQLCSAGNSVPGNDKSGMDLPSPDWHTSTVAKDQNQAMRLKFKATMAHDPSFWVIYLSKPGYDPAKASLTWNDLEEVGRFDNVKPVGGYYEMNVDLKDTLGQRVLYTRWQRVDSAGEGFYNCSDVNIVASAAKK